MKLKYKNYTIVDDRNSFILRETWIIKDWKSKWKEFQKDVMYPNTLSHCLRIIIDRETKKRLSVNNLQWLIEELRLIQEDILQWLENMLKDYSTVNTLL